MAFTFESTEIQLTINGVDCTLDVGDAEMQDRLAEAASVAQTSTPEVIGVGANVQASQRLRDIVAAILGEDATRRIYEGRRPNIYEDVQLVLYLKRAMDEAEPTKRFEETMDTLSELIGMDD